MRVVPQRMTDVWKSGRMTGANRPICRATIQRTHITPHRYASASSQLYASYLFGNPFGVYELPNIKSFSWQRSTDSDAATATMVLYNAKPLPIGQKPSDNDWVYGQPGFFTFNRGTDINPWDHEPNFWTNRLYPDMTIRTYEGYGFDPTLGPEADPNLMPSGVWLIDTVELGTDKLITVKMRDASRLLLDQIAFPPVIPTSSYPLYFSHFKQVANPKKPVITGAAHWINPSYYDDSGQPYYGKNASLGGHRPSDAFDGSDSSYWVSVGNASPSADYAYEWIEGKIPTSKVAAVRVYVKGGPYRCYVSLHTTDKGWVGNATVPYNPYDPVSSPNGADIKFVKSQTVLADRDNVIDVRDTPNVDRVRLTFHNLDYLPIPGHAYNYRAEVRDVDVLVGSTTTTWESNGSHWVGNYSDYSDIVKWLLCYAGFFWPADPDIAFQNVVGDRVQMTPPHPDAVTLHKSAWHYDNNGNLVAEDGTPLDVWLTTGKTTAGVPIPGDIWADIENSGTYGPADLTTDIFDKKPLMDGVAYIRDMLGFIFHIDENGAAQFRSPNIWNKGNWLRHPGDRVTSVASRVTPTTETATGNPWCVTIHEKQTLRTLKATLDSKNVRERIVIANVAGDLGAVTAGFLPYRLPAGGFRRIGIWSDQHFTTREECQIMADLISVRQLFSYRQDTIRIPGYPAIQIDDQVKLVEETTEEADDIHYVTGISSTLDMSAGEWWYDVSTHWLGTEPFSDWAFRPSVLASETREYLQALGKVT